MFVLVTASFFVVCGVSATSFDGYYQYGTVTSIVTDKVIYNDMSIRAGTESYFDVNFTFGQVTYYNSTMQQISVGSARYSTSVGILSISCSEPSVVISYDEDNRVHCLFQNDFSGDLHFSIKYYIRNTFTGGSPSNATLQNITMRRAVTTHYGNMNHSFNGTPSFGIINDKLDQILDALGQSSSIGTDYLGSDALIYFRKDYFNDLWANQAVLPNSDGLFVIPSVSGCSNLTFTNNTMAAFSISPGTYLVSFTCYFSNKPTSISFLGYPLDKFECVADWQINNLYRVCGIFTVDKFSTYREVSVAIEGATFNPGVFYGGVSRASDDAIASGAINPDQSGLIDDVDNAGKQQAQQEEQLWTNINSYKGDLTFNLDDWSEAAGGLSYVSGIFMSIWNNSPTQIIVLSLMLGIAMLSIGRGAMAAVRVSRNRRDDD